MPGSWSSTASAGVAAGHGQGVPPPPPTTFRWLIGRQPPEQDRPRFTSRLRAFARVNPWLGARNVADVVRVRSEAVRSGGGLAG